MLEMLSYDFMQNALAAGLLVSIAAGFIGTFVVVNRMVFLAGGIAHSAYGGIGLSIFFGFSMLLGAGLFAIASALLMAWLTYDRTRRPDTIIGVIWALGMAVGIIFTDLTPGYNVDLMSYLFGSILAVPSEDLYFMAALDALILALTLLFYKPLLALSYDPEFARLRGVRVKLFYFLLLCLTALTVVVAIRVVGLIMVIALLTIPTYIAEQLSASLLGMMVRATVLAALFTAVGLLLAYYYDITSGAAIIVAAAAGFFLFMGITGVRGRR
jgi:zinc transport system permease protein